MGGDMTEQTINPDIRTKLLDIERDLRQRFFERDEIARAMITAALARQHLLLLGPPGTAKSQMTATFCRRIGGRFFYRLLNRQSPVEEILGPVSAKGLMEDRYYRATNHYLPEADIGFLDEIWHCNSSTLNALLDILNEREFTNDGQRVKVPLQFAVGASNELPEDREELGALFDRFLLRYVVGYLRDDRNFERLLTLPPDPDISSLVTVGDLATAQTASRMVQVNGLIPVLRDLRRSLATDDQIVISDRRWRLSLDLVRANAWLEGRDLATEDDLVILAGVIWQEKEQVPTVRKRLMKIASPLLLEAQDLFDQAHEQYSLVMQAEEQKKIVAASEAVSKLNIIVRQLEGLRVKAGQRGKSEERIREFIDKVDEWRDDLVSNTLGVKLKR